HWVSAADAVDAEVRLYNQLFTKADPDAANFAAEINPQSVEVIAGAKIEPALATDNIDAPVQFERQGYFHRDPDSTPGRPVFNRTVGRVDSGAKVSGRDSAGKSGGWAERRKRSRSGPCALPMQPRAASCASRRLRRRRKHLRRATRKNPG